MSIENAGTRQSGLISPLKTIVNRLFKFDRRSAEAHERDVIAKQIGLYGMGIDHRPSAFNYDRAEFTPDYRTKILLPFIRRLKKKVVTPQVLDLGAGKGEASFHMAINGAKTVKLDISNSGLIGNRNAVQSTAWRLPFSDGSFDGIHTKDMMTHIPPEFRQILFSELYRVTKPKGEVLIFTAEELSGPAAMRHQYQTTQAELIELAEKQGFVLEGTRRWIPTSDTKDWYIEQKPRIALQLRK